MTRERLHWTVKADWSPFFCFTKGCNKEASYVVRIELESAIVQLCLCGDCSDEAPDSIMSGVTAKQEHTKSKVRKILDTTF